MAAGELVVAITGASGSIYGVRLLEVLLKAGRRVHLAISPAATEVMRGELHREVDLNHFDPRQLLDDIADEVDLNLLRYYNYRNFSSGIASGSFIHSGMAICPCSMGTVAAIAHGLSENLIQRAADVALKERRKLVLVPRETPLGTIQLRNMLTCSEAGAVVLPAMPGFYNNPQTVGEMVDFVVGRVCDQLGVEHRLFARWGHDISPTSGE